MDGPPSSCDQAAPEGLTGLNGKGDLTLLEALDNAELLIWFVSVSAFEVLLQRLAPEKAPKRPVAAQHDHQVVVVHGTTEEAARAEHGCDRAPEAVEGCHWLSDAGWFGLLLASLVGVRYWRLLARTTDTSMLDYLVHRTTIEQTPDHRRRCECLASQCIFSAQTFIF